VFSLGKEAVTILKRGKSVSAMRKRKRTGLGVRGLALVEGSPLRRADPRTKLALSLCASLAVMLPLERLAVFMALYIALLLWARLLPEAARQAWRLKWILLVLFLVDWVVVSLDLAIVITLRLVLLAGAFSLFFASTTPGELRLALEWMRLPYRYAFSLGLAFQSLGLLGAEWRAILEAQQARGAWAPSSGWRNLGGRLRDMVALAVPAITLTTKRAWALTEAAYTRGFDSPHRRPYRRLIWTSFDSWLLAGSAALMAALLIWR
jgi:energy-coupling factor transporter transmembrane protein EcfT